MVPPPKESLLSLALVSLPLVALLTPTLALNCDAPLPGTQNTTYSSNATPCLLRCHDSVTIATGTLLPGMLNSTAIPYCYLDCVHTDTTPAQSALAPECSSTCEDSGHAGNIEVLGWCVYWCVDGYADEVKTSSCVPRYAFEPVTTVVDGRTETLTLLTNPAGYTSSSDESTSESSEVTSSRETTSTSTSDASTASFTSTNVEASTSTSAGGSAVADSAEPTSTDNAGTTLYAEWFGLVASLCIMLLL
ncbi:hypothetical protein BJY01DRAFT_132783 [Aspergillus pseudoustus]|uniref:WSC domain-containing protein n=1 Tax=Aspergillus pseudoustus TaxID=1810923 RepID=A0ABR4INH6_9EURO